MLERATRVPHARLILCMSFTCRCASEHLQVSCMALLGLVISDLSCLTIAFLFLQDHTPPQIVIVFFRCIDASSNCYILRFLLFLTDDQDRVVMKNSYNQSRQINCSTHRLTLTFYHSLIVCLLDYLKIVSNDFLLVKNRYEPIFNSMALFLNFIGV